MAKNMVSQDGGWYDAWKNNEDSKGFRVINTAEIPAGDKLQFAYVLTYGQADNIIWDWESLGAGKNEWAAGDDQLLSAVVRPIYQWDDYNKTMLELGYFTFSHDTDNNGKEKWVVKRLPCLKPGQPVAVCMLAQNCVSIQLT